MRLLLWIATSCGICMANLDWYCWHPWLAVRRMLVLGFPVLALTVVLLAQDALPSAVAERLGRLEVQVGRLETEAEKAEQLHRVDMALLTGGQQDLRNDVVEGQATLTASLRTMETAWSVIAGLLLLYTARKSWSNSRTWVRDWQKSHHHNSS